MCTLAFVLAGDTWNLGDLGDLGDLTYNYFWGGLQSNSIWGQYVLGMGVQMGMMCYSTRYSSYTQVSIIQVRGLCFTMYVSRVIRD